VSPDSPSSPAASGSPGSPLPGPAGISEPFWPGVSHPALLQSWVVLGMPRPSGTPCSPPSGPTAPSPVPGRVAEPAPGTWHPRVLWGGGCHPQLSLRATSPGCLCPMRQPSSSRQHRLVPRQHRIPAPCWGHVFPHQLPLWGGDTPKTFCSGNRRPREGNRRPSSSAGPVT